MAEEVWNSWGFLAETIVIDTVYVISSQITSLIDPHTLVEGGRKNPVSSTGYRRSLFPHGPRVSPQASSSGDFSGGVKALRNSVGTPVLICIN